MVFILVHSVGLYLFESKRLVLLEGLLWQGAQLTDLFHAFFFLLQQHSLSVGHLLQLLGVMVDRFVLLFFNVLPALHALLVVFYLQLSLIDEGVQICEMITRVKCLHTVNLIAHDLLNGNDLRVCSRLTLRSSQCVFDAFIDAIQL